MGWRKGGKTVYQTSQPKDLKLNSKQVASSDAHYKNERVGKISLYYTDQRITDHLENQKAAFQMDIQSLIKATQNQINHSVFIQVVSFGAVVLALLTSLLGY
jgi:hypothetical protein